MAATCGGSPVAPPITQPPTPLLTVTCPGSLETPSAGGAPIPITYTAAAAAGGAAPVVVTCTPATGSLFPAGTTTVTCQAADSRGQQASCTFGVTVNSVTPRLLKTRFMTFGDSLTEGDLSSIPPSQDAGPHSYPSTLRRLLIQRYTEQTVTLANEGKGGERADESLDRLEGVLFTHRPEVVLLMHGVNDLNGANAARVTETAEAIEELIDIVQDAGVIPLVATLPPLGPGPKALCPECVGQLNDRIRTIAAARGATLVDVHTAWSGGTGLMGGDGIHPTSAGYEVIAQAFLDAVKKTLEAPPGVRFR